MGNEPRKRPFTEVSTTEADLSVGNLAEDENGIRYIKCLAVEAIGIDSPVATTATDAVSNRGYLVPNVDEADAIADTSQVIGFNNTGAIVPINSYFWAAVGPIVTALAGTTGSITTGADLYASATAGEVDDVTTGATRLLGVALTDSSGAGTQITLRSFL
jgi:hypothetical protein